MCGAALPQDVAAADDDDVLSLMMGLVCTACESYNDPGTAACVMCGTPLGDGVEPTSTQDMPTVGSAEQPAAPAPAPAPAPAGGGAAPSWMAAPEGKPLATANAMPAVDLAAVSAQQGLAAPATGAAPVTPAPATPACSNCGNELKPDDKFCASCGTRVGAVAAPAPAPAPAAAQPPPGGAARTQIMAAVPPAGAPQPPANAPAATMMMPSLNVNAGLPNLGGGAPAAGAPSATMFFGAAQVERVARLILIKGHTQFGTQWRLQAAETVIGKNQGMVLFPEDPYLADKHCTLQFRGDELWVVPERTTNGVWLQLKGEVELLPGAEFIAGGSRFRLVPDHERALAVAAPTDDTRQFGVPADNLKILLMRMADTPAKSETYARPQRLLSIGRHGCDLNFASDGYLSTRHAQVTRDADRYILEDLNSRNGTFYRIDDERKLSHGDGLLLGEQVMRVEVKMGIPGMPG
jgi:pSer/pThr/pTyr-binding forkhead associated (FHA) protein